MRRARTSETWAFTLGSGLVLSLLVAAGTARAAVPNIDLNGAPAGNDFAATFTEGGAAVLLEAATATVTDSDSANLASLTVTITNLLDGASESLSANAGATGITVSYNPATGVLSLTGNRSLANYQTVLRTVSYQNLSDAPSTTARAITFVANDGTSNSIVRTTTLTVVAVNDVPVVDLNGAAAGTSYSTTFTEDGGAVLITASTATVTDLDHANLASLTITISNLLDGALESLSASTGATGIVASYNPATGVLTLTGASSVANYQQVLRTVTYDNTSNTPSTTARTINLAASDGSGWSAVATTTLAIVAANDAPVVDLNGAAAGNDFAATFTEGGAAVLIASATATVSDADSAQLAALNLTITNLLDGPSESLAASPGATGIVASYNPATGVLTLTGASSVANYQQVLRTVTYSNSSEAPSATPRVLTCIATDGAGSSAVSTSTITVVPVNDLPVVDLNGAAAGYDFSAGYTAGGAPVLVAGATATVIDVDSPLLASLTITITNLQGDGLETLSASTAGTAITASYNPATGVLSLTGPDTSAAYQQVLRTVAYQNLSDAPSTTPRSLTFVASDGTDSSVVRTSTVTVVAVNDGPVIDLNGVAAGFDFATTFTEDGGAVPIASAGATVTDPDSANLASLTVTLTSRPDGALESLSASPGATGITVAYNPATGVLSLTGSAAVASYQQVLRTVTYDNTSGTPSTAPRSLTFVASDGTDSSVVRTTTLTVAAVNDVPVLDLNGAAAGNDHATTFTEGGGPVGLVAATATLTDVDSASLASLTVTITNRLDGSAESLAASVAGTAITSSYSAATGVLTLYGSDTVAAYQQVLRTVTYQNTSTAPSTTARSVTFVASDGVGSSAARTCTVTVISVNDVPVIDLNGPGAGHDHAATFTEGGAPVPLAAATATVTDADGDLLVSLAATLTNRLDGAAESLAADTTGTAIAAAYDPATGVLTLNGLDTATAYQQVLRTVTYDNLSTAPSTPARSITFVAFDGTGTSLVRTTTVALVVVDDAPIIDLNGPAVGADFTTSATEDTGPVALAAPGATVTDPEGDLVAWLTATLTNPLDGAAESLAASTSGTVIVATWDAGAGALRLTGADTAARYQQVLRTLTYQNTSQAPDATPRVITFVASDGLAESLVRTTTVSVVATNDPPVLVDPTPTATLSIPSGVTLHFQVAAEDPDGDPLSYAAEPLPPGATLDPGTGIFTWTPGPLDGGVWSITVSASDGLLVAERVVTVVVVITDRDGDGLPDTWEQAHGLDPNSPDSDGDTIADLDEVGDPAAPRDTDGDGILDALDHDSDGDTIADRHEAGDADPGTPPVDTDGDGVPDYRQTDADSDGIPDAEEAGDADLDTPPVDTDRNGVPDFQQTDADGDGVPDGVDNCRLVQNADQSDADGDGRGDACDVDDPDSDHDGVPDEVDNCPAVANPDQRDTDADGLGDACDDDDDGDGILDDIDQCPLVAGSPSAEGCPEAPFDATGCGCASADPGAPLLAVLVLPLLLWRRRRRR
jgi:uncharacterized protein (TIGR03382 family)